MTKEELAKSIIESGVLINKPTKARSGELLDYYFNMEKAYAKPELLEAIVDQLAELVGKKASCVAGSGYGGIPLAVLLSQKLNIPLTLVRNENKNHGQEGLISGYIPKERDNVVVVDDVFVTGSSISDTISILKNTKANFLRAIVIIKRTDREIDIPILYIFKSEDLLTNPLKKT